MSWWKKYLNQKGSVFIFVLMMMTVLMILGTALLFASTANYAMNAAYIKGNRSFYWADGWIEKINNTLEEYSMYVQKSAKEFANSKKEEIIERYTYKDIATGEEYVDDEKIEKALIIEYMDAFNRYATGEWKLNGVFDLEDGTSISFDGSKDLKTILEEIFNTWSVTEPLMSVSYMDVSSCPVRDTGVDLDLQMDQVDEEIVISVEVTSQKEQVEKKIAAQFKLLKSPQQIPMKKVLTRKINPIWMRGITTESSVVAVDGDVDITGDVYAYGNLPPDNSSEEEYGGIIAGMNPELAVKLGINTTIAPGSSKGELTIDGAARTRANLHTAYGLSGLDGSRISVTGNTFCESVQIDSDSENSTIDIDGDVYAYNDLKINSGNSSIHIGGSYYGFMEGGQNSYQFNKSSAIILNDASSSIQVDGEAIIGGKVFVENVYVNTYDAEGNPITVPYKTGESVSIFKNYSAYRHQLDYEDLLDFYPPWSPFSMYWGVDIPALEPLTNRLLITDSRNPNSDNNTRVTHFLDYFKDFPSDIITGGVVLGDNDVPDPVMKVYAPGIILSDGYVIDLESEKVYDPSTGIELPEFKIPLSSGKKKQIIKSGGDGEEYIEYFNSKQKEWKKLFNQSTWIQPGKPDDDYKDIEEEPEFKDLVNDTIDGSTLYENTINVTKTDEATGVENTEDYYAYVNISDSDVTLDADRINGKQGLVFVMGDLYINGSTSDLDFTGTIIAKGNIVFYGTGRKTITYDENVLKELIYHDEPLEAFFKKGNKIVDLQAIDITLSLQATRNIELKSWREIP